MPQCRRRRHRFIFNLTLGLILAPLSPSHSRTPSLPSFSHSLYVSPLDIDRRDVGHAHNGGNGDGEDWEVRFLLAVPLLFQSLPLPSSQSVSQESRTHCD